jgi:hypothetical protein
MQTTQTKYEVKFLESQISFYKTNIKGTVEPSTVQIDETKLIFKFNEIKTHTQRVLCELNLHYKPDNNEILLIRGNPEVKTNEIITGDKLWYISSGKTYQWNVLQVDAKEKTNCDIFEKMNNLTLKDFRGKSFKIESNSIEKQVKHPQFSHSLGKLKIPMFNFDIPGYTYRQLREEMFVQDEEYLLELQNAKRSLFSKLESGKIFELLNSYKGSLEMHFLKLLKDIKKFCGEQENKMEKSEKNIFVKFQKKIINY